jgi:hypothetical protein
MTLSANFLVAPSQTVAHHSGRKYTATAAGVVAVPIPDAYSFHPGGQFLYWSTATAADRPVNVAGATPWTNPVLEAGTMIWPIAGTTPIRWINASGSTV